MPSKQASRKNKPRPAPVSTVDHGWSPGAVVAAALFGLTIALVGVYIQQLYADLDGDMLVDDIIATHGRCVAAACLPPTLAVRPI